MLTEPPEKNGIRITGRRPLTVTALGATREQALARLREAIVRRMAEGSVLVPLDIERTEDHP